MKKEEQNHEEIRANKDLKNLSSQGEELYI